VPKLADQLLHAYSWMATCVDCVLEWCKKASVVLRMMLPTQSRRLRVHWNNSEWLLKSSATHHGLTVNYWLYTQFVLVIELGIVLCSGTVVTAALGRP